MAKTRSSNLSIGFQKYSELPSEFESLSFSKNQLIEKNKFAIEVATRAQDKEAIYRLAYELYLEKGYCNKSDRKYLKNNYDFLETTIPLAIKIHNEIVGSLTIVDDMGSKLPYESVFPELKNKLDEFDLRCVEITRLLLADHLKETSIHLNRLINLTFIYVFQILRKDIILIEVNPRHVQYYKKLLGFEIFHEGRVCPRVGGAPAVMMGLKYKTYSNALEKKEEGFSDYSKRSALNQIFCGSLVHRSKGMFNFCAMQTTKELV